MTDLEAMVIEWRNAREAILLVNWGDPAVAKANAHLWVRLGHAEAALMSHARAMVTIQWAPGDRGFDSWEPDPTTGCITVTLDGMAR